MAMLLRPQRGGSKRAIGCGTFIRLFLMGHGPHGTPTINLDIGAPQADIFRHYKETLRRETAYDRATRIEERKARKEKRVINPENIEKLAQRYLVRLPYKAQGCRYHSFITYFSNLVRLGWVELTGQEETSEFQDHYPSGQPRKYYRLTAAGRAASDADWANPQFALYGGR